MSELASGEPFTSRIIEIKVGRGEAQKIYRAHESVLSQYSLYFKAVFDPPTGVSENSIRCSTPLIFEDEILDDPETFGLFLHHAYNCGLTLHTQTIQREFSKGQLVQHVKLYVLGVRLQSTSARKLAFAALRNRLQCYYSYFSFSVDVDALLKDLVEATKFIYSSTILPFALPRPSDDEDDGGATENKEDDIASLKGVRKLLIEYLLYNIKAVREGTRAELMELAKNEVFCVDMLLSEDLVSETTTRLCTRIRKIKWDNGGLPVKLRFRNPKSYFLIRLSFGKSNEHVI